MYRIFNFKELYFKLYKMSEFKKLLGKRIKELRKSKGYTQDFFAELVDIGTANISNIETGKSSPTPENLLKIANVLDVTPNDLYMVKHLKSKDEILNEMFENLSKNEELLNLVYKFYITVK